jgi:hypothetical protein
MAYTIKALGRTFIVSPHTDNRMLVRAITEVMLIEVLEDGSIEDQPHGRTKYEKEIEGRIIGVIVNEANNTIVTVIDYSDQD